MNFTIAPKVRPELDPDFCPAVLWNRAYRQEVEKCFAKQDIVIALRRSNGTVSTCKTTIFPHEGEYAAVNIKYVERLVKFLLWMKGGYEVTIAGCFRSFNRCFRIF